MHFFEIVILLIALSAFSSTMFPNCQTDSEAKYLKCKFFPHHRSVFNLNQPGMKNKLLIVTMLLIFPASLSFGQVTSGEKSLRTENADTVAGWKTGGILAANLSQTSLKYWAAGGQNSVAVNGIISVFANLKSGISSWDNSLDLGYGVLKEGRNGSFRKTDDKIEFASKYGRKALKNLYYAFLVNFRTQFAPGYNYAEGSSPKISDLFSPAYLTIALGLDYKPASGLSLFFAPVTGRFTFVTDKTLSAAGAFGVTPGETVRSEFGGYFRGVYSKNDFKGEFMKNVAITTKLDLFSNYSDKPQNVDVNWETLIALKVNKFISVSFNTDLIYDDNIKVPFDRNNDGVVSPGESIGPKTQFKEILGVGFSYKF